MSEQELSLEKDLTIDIQRMDSEWITLPSLYFKYREEGDYLDIRLRKLKIELDFETAKLDGTVRSDPMTYVGVEKPTEAQIRCYIASSDKIFELQGKILELEKKRKLLASACAGLEMKRDSLKYLTQLINGEYFTTRCSDKSMLAHIASNGEKTKRNIRREIRKRMNPQKSQED